MNSSHVHWITLYFLWQKELTSLLKEKEEEQEHFNFQEHIKLLYDIYWVGWPINSETVFYSLCIPIKLTIFLCNTCIYIDKEVAYIN